MRGESASSLESANFLPTARPRDPGSSGQDLWIVLGCVRARARSCTFEKSQKRQKLATRGGGNGRREGPHQLRFFLERSRDW